VAAANSQGDRLMAANGFDDDQTGSFTKLAAGSEVLHFKIIPRNRAGGVSEDHLAEDSQLDHRVAQKIKGIHRA